MLNLKIKPIVTSKNNRNIWLKSSIKSFYIDCYFLLSRFLRTIFQDPALFKKLFILRQQQFLQPIYELVFLLFVVLVDDLSAIASQVLPSSKLCCFTCPLWFKVKSASFKLGSLNNNIESFRFIHKQIRYLVYV